MRARELAVLLSCGLFVFTPMEVARADTATNGLADTSLVHLTSGDWKAVVDSLSESKTVDFQQSRLLCDILRAAIVLAPNNQRLELSRQLPSDDWLAEKLTELNEVSALKIDPAGLSLDDLRLVSSVIQSIQNAVLEGRPDRIDELVNDETLAKELGSVGASMQAYARVMRDIASRFSDSEMSALYKKTLRVNDQSVAIESKRDSWLGDYRNDPESAEVGRSGDNEYSVLRAKEDAKVKLVDSYTKLYTAYRDGELTRAKALREMAALDSDLLNNREKRVLLYWKLRELNQKFKLAKRQKTIDQNRKRRNSRGEQSEMYKTLSWPTAFSHPDLSTQASALQRHLTTYNTQNSGPLSACYAKCSSCVKSLCNTLQSDLDGIPATQRAALVSYLRTLIAEVAAPYAPDGYVATLQLRDFAGSDLYAAEPKRTVTIPAGLLSAEIDLNNEAEVASYAVCRSLLNSMLLATRSGDRKRLREIANRIQASGLLVAQHKEILNKVGSSLYRKTAVPGQSDDSMLEELEATLASLSGADGTSLVGMSGLSDQYQAEAFDTLVNQLVPETDG